MLSLPWWGSAVTGVLLFILLTVLKSSLSTGGGAIGKSLAQAFGYLPTAVLVGFGFISLLSALRRWILGQRVEGQTSIESIRRLSWQAFEGLVAEAYQRKGYIVEHSLAGGTDGGVDLVLRKDGQTTLVQCKQWRSSAVGAPIIREIFGVQTHEKADRAIVITSGHFTREAEAFAAGKAMELVDGEQLLALVRSVQTEARARPPAPTAPTPACPKCGSPMALRTAKRGAKSGNQFWGCTTYPACNGTRDS